MIGNCIVTLLYTFGMDLSFIRPDLPVEACYGFGLPRYGYYQLIYQCRCDYIFDKYGVGISFTQGGK